MIERSCDRNGNINTKLFNVINSIPKHCICSSEHGLREPVGIYNIAFTRVLDNLNKVLEKYNNVKSNEIDNVLNDIYVQFLESINEFIDGIYNVFKSVYSTSNIPKPNERFAYKWLEKNTNDKILFDTFFSNIKDYKTYLGLIVNKIKHEQGEFATIRMQYKYFKAWGYCVLAFDDLVAKPDDDIHPRFSGKSTGNSFCYDINYHLFNVYDLCEYASDALISIIRSNYNIDIADTPTDYANNRKLTEIIKKVADLSNIYFPNELQKVIYRFKYNEGALKIDTVNRRSLYEIRNCAVKYLFVSDGTTITYTLPYK